MYVTVELLVYLLNRLHSCMQFMSLFVPLIYSVDAICDCGCNDATTIDETRLTTTHVMYVILYSNYATLDVPVPSNRYTRTIFMGLEVGVENCDIVYDVSTYVLTLCDVIQGHASDWLAQCHRVIN